MTFLEPLEQRRLLSGITLITHGQGGSAGGDVKETADRIATRAGGATQYIMTLVEDGVSAEVGSFTRDPSTPAAPASGEIIIRLDWSDVTLPTPAIASAVADFMTTRMPDGSSLVDSELHLAGPSRGASVVSNLAIEFAQRGVWVDHVSYIDPVPIPIVDGPMQVPDNVIFADNYWRSDNNVITGFDGQHVDGAHEGDLNSTVQADNFGDPHTGTGAYYIATIDPTEPIVPPAKASWFQGTADAPARDRTGFFFSQIAGGMRPADGLNPAWGGTAHRDNVTRSGSQWSNVGYLNLHGPTTVPDGRIISVSFLFDDRDSASTVSLFLDRDRNPYNGNGVSRIAQRTYGATTGLAAARLIGSTAEATPGTYYIYAQIRDASGHIRYSYLRNALTITAPTSNDIFATLTSGHLLAQGDNTNENMWIISGPQQTAVTRHDFTQLFNTADITSITMDGAGGNDTIIVGNTLLGVQLLGGGGNDKLVGSNLTDYLDGGPGKDLVFGLNGNDRIFGGSGNDALFGGGGRDRIYGGPDNDAIDGGTGDDRLFGGDGADIMNGGLGDFDLAVKDDFDSVGRVEIVLKA